MYESATEDEWKRKKAKLEVIDDLITYIGYKYQKLGGEIFSEYIHSQKDLVPIKDFVAFLDNLATSNIPESLDKRVTLLVAHSDMLKELVEVGKELQVMVKELQPPTHSEAPVPKVNS